MIGALVFDFDGLILDTESALFDAWQATYGHFGATPFTIEEWVRSIGLHDDDPERLDPMVRLLAELGEGVDTGEIHRLRRSIRDEWLAGVDVGSGVIELAEEARAFGIPVGIASSSPLDWLEHHLDDRCIRTHFEIISCAGEGIPGKPDPAVYLKACAQLGCEPGDAVAFEDSPNGIAAARAAGLFCVAVPNPMTARLEFSAADMTLTDLAEIGLADLELALATRQ